MALFREEYLTIQDEYLRVDPSREESNEDDDLEYSNDDLGENTEITPLGDAVDDKEPNDLYKRAPGDDDDFGGGDDVEIDLDTDEVEEEEEIEEYTAQIDPLDDDDLDDEDDLGDDDDLLDDDLDTPGIVPDLDDDDDLLDDDDDLLDEEDDLDDDDTTARTSINTDADFASRPHGRTTGTMLDHEPGLPG